MRGCLPGHDPGLLWKMGSPRTGPQGLRGIPGRLQCQKCASGGQKLFYAGRGIPVRHGNLEGGRNLPLHRPLEFQPFHRLRPLADRVHHDGGDQAPLVKLEFVDVEQWSIPLLPECRGL